MKNYFFGYHRPDGSVGIRNVVLILPIMKQMNLLAKKISDFVPDTKAFISTGEAGRTLEDRRLYYRVLTGLALNPNVGAVLVIGASKSAGYDELKADNVIQAIEKAGKPIEVLMSAEEGGTYSSLSKGLKMARHLVWQASRNVREKAGLSRLSLGVKCGLSDSTSGICGNPVVGGVFDKVVRAGGRSIFSETTEIIGAEDILARRAKNKTVAEKLLHCVARLEEKAKATGEDIRTTNPIPENIAGGLTTLEEKSLGAIAKSGNEALEDVLQYAERMDDPGLYFMDGWMSSYSLPVGFVASGVQLFLYQLGGQGVPGPDFPPPAISSGIVAPIMYLTGNSQTYSRNTDMFDFNSGTVLENSESYEACVDRLLKQILEIASGAKTRAETINYDDPIELYFQGPCL